MHLSIARPCLVCAGLFLWANPSPLRAESRTIGVFHDLIESAMARTLEPIEREMSAAGLKVTHLTSQDLLAGPRSDVLLYPAGKRYPAGAEKSIYAYLRKGGKLIVLGGPAFSEPAWRVGDSWRSWADLRADLGRRAPDHLVFGFDRPDDARGWGRSTNDEKAPGGVTAGSFGGPHGRSLQIEIGNLSGWDNWGHPVAGLPPGRGLFTFHARGDARTGYVMVELAERDGSRWIAAQPITQEWSFYALAAEDFKYWHDSGSKGRGGAGDRVHFESVGSLAIGLAYTHTPVEPGLHRIWIDEIAVQKDPRPAASASSPLVLDGLSPAYKYYPVGFLRSDRPYFFIGTQKGFVPEGGYPISYERISVSPRPQGSGFDKGRRLRFVPLIEMLHDNVRRAGSRAWLVLNGPGEYAGSAWAVFGTNSPAFYTAPKVRQAVAGLAKKLISEPYLYEGGSQYYAYFHDDTEVKLGARVVVPPFANWTSLKVSVSVTHGTDVACEHVWPIRADNSVIEKWNKSRVVAVSWVWRPEKAVWSRGPFRVHTELLHGDRVIDELYHDLNVWTPKLPGSRAYVTVLDGHFVLNGKPWVAHGVNYMPSSGIAIEDTETFEQWLSAHAYDPDVIESDLSQIQSLSMNTISVFVYHQHLRSRNLLDLLMRAERHGLKVNLSLRPHADPFDYRPDEVRDMIRTARLAENDTVFAYDLAWERGFGNYEPSYYNAKGRKGYDAEWKAWVLEQYGSIENAEADWEVRSPRRNGELTGPPDAQLDQDGPWRKMVAAYRRFVDDLTSHTYGRAARHIRSLDPHHLISFRMTIAGDPTAPPREFPFDFRGLARSLDIMEPEGYGRVGDWQNVRDGAFTVAYSRYAAPGRPVYWAEFGRSGWAGTNFLEKNTGLTAIGRFYDDFYRMIALSWSDGSSAWWYPGGYRKNEESDYGIVSPDGTDRPATAAIRKRLPELYALAQRPVPPVDTWIEVDRDADARGLRGIYERVKAQYWKAIASGHRVALKDAGAGTTSVNTPLIAVGNAICSGRNPPKFLNAEFDRLEVKNASGRWVDVAQGRFLGGVPVVEVATGRPVLARATVGNTQTARWIAPPRTIGEQPVGTIGLATTPESEIQMARAVPILRDTPLLGTAEVGPFELTAVVEKESGVTLRMRAWKRAWFGAIVRFRLKPVH